jgi:XTP/dITP diphosphohydrolase
MRCVLASGNAKKAKELTELLATKGWQVSLQSELGVVQPAEDGLTFVENALIKARAASEQTGLPAIADDSGLVVPELQGAPGIFSARFAGETASDAENNAQLLSVMHDLVDEQRDAYFVSVIVFLRHAQDPLPIVAQGVWHGRILHQAVGEGGFGYDPLFWVPTHGCASAQLPSEVKQRISHRGLAMASLLAQLS